MKDIIEVIKNQIKEAKEEIISLTNQIQQMRSDSDEEDQNIIQELQGKLELLTEKLAILKSNMQIYRDANKSDAVSVGSYVEIVDKENKNKRDLLIVLEEDADTQNGFISEKSPIGSSMLGKRVGDSVEFTVPNGTRVLQIKKIK